MLQVCTFDSWAEAIARDSSDGSITLKSALFFVSYVILVGWVILNIVVAVLLDEFVESVTKDRNEEIEKALLEEKKQQRYGKRYACAINMPSSAKARKRVMRTFQPGCT